MTAEFEHLVEKQHAVVREAHFARPRLRAAADERGIRDRVMRRAERAIAQEPGFLLAAPPSSLTTVTGLDYILAGRGPDRINRPPIA